MADSSSMSSTGKGVLLGLANLLVIAVGAAFMAGAPEGGVLLFLAVSLLGFVPAIAAGAFIGMLAGSLEEHPLVRMTIIGLCGFAGVMIMGAILQATELILPAYIPTLVAASILERWTRHEAVIPKARIRIVGS
jgi:hypothetical protein